MTNKNTCIYYRHFQIKFEVRCKAFSSLRTSLRFISTNVGIISLLRRPCVACDCMICVLFQQIGSPRSHFKRLNCTPEKARDTEVKLWTKCFTYEYEIIARSGPRSGQTPEHGKKQITKSSTHFSTGTIGLLLAGEIPIYWATWKTQNIPPILH
jgi:hypothetical protein